jgi:oligopeptide transport system substrate-binding protein
MAVRSFLVAASLLPAALSLAACHSQRAACPAGLRCLEYGDASDPATIDPQLAQTTYEAAILRELFEGLVADGADGAPVPGVAKSWEVSPDGLVWTFHLRRETWSDGAPLTAHDFAFAYRRMLDPKTGSAYAYLLYILKNAEAASHGGPLDRIGVKALDDETLQLTLEHPAPYLPQLLKHQAFFPAPEHAVRRWGAAWVTPGRMVSNGAYELADWRLGDYLRIIKNPRYRDAGQVCFDRVDFYPLNDLVSTERRVLRGELDVNAGVQSNRVARLRSRPDSARYVRSHPYLTTTYMIFNRRDVGPLKDVRVRQAISMAIDRDFITQKLTRAGQVPTTSFVPRGIAGYLPPAAPHPGAYWADWPLPRRQAEARRLLAELGYSPARPLKLELKTFNSPGSLIVAQSIQSDLKTVGVDATFRQEDGAVIFESFNIRDFQLGLAAWVADFDDPMTFLGLMRSDTGAQNYGDYKNPRYDALLDAADHEPEAGKRAQYLAQAEQLMLDDADVAPVLNGVNLNLVAPDITGWVDNDADIHPIRYLCRRDAVASGPNRGR